MKIKVVDRDRSGVMKDFAKALGTTMEGRIMYIPESKGGGYITGFMWEDDMRMLVRNYYLKEEIVFERINIVENKHIIFCFDGVFELPEKAVPVTARYVPPTVFIFSQTVSSVVTMPAHTFFRSINIAVSQDYLQQLVGHLTHPVIGRILENKEHFAFEAPVTPRMIKIAHEIISEKIPENLESLFFRLKCEEMLCFLFAGLTEREEEPVSKMHIDDIKAIYRIKEQLHLHPDEAPGVAVMAKAANMSQPKLRRLFKQTFGKSVYDYYQAIRMQEAGRLLKEKHLSVADVGYRLGFSNLSHFGRIFEAHMGMKPKKWSVT